MKKLEPDEDFIRMILDGTKEAERLTATIAEVIAKNEEAKMWAVSAALLAIGLTAIEEMNREQQIVSKSLANFLCLLHGLPQPIKEYAIPSDIVQRMFPEREKERESN